MGSRTRIALETGLTTIGIMLITFGANLLMGPFSTNALLQGLICIGIGALLIALDKYLIVSSKLVSIVLKHLIPWLVAAFIVALILSLALWFLAGLGGATAIAFIATFIILCVIIFCAVTSE
jgi:hypothetical protein